MNNVKCIRCWKIRKHEHAKVCINNWMCHTKFDFHLLSLICMKVARIMYNGAKSICMLYLCPLNRNIRKFDATANTSKKSYCNFTNNFHFFNINIVLTQITSDRCVKQFLKIKTVFIHLTYLIRFYLNMCTKICSYKLFYVHASYIKWFDTHNKCARDPQNQY